MRSRGGDMTGISAMPLRLGREATVSMRAVADAIRLVRAVEHDVSTGVLTKSDASPVTLADFAVQALVAARLARDFPDDALVAEEDATALRAPDSARLAGRILDLVKQVDASVQTDRVQDWIDRGRGVPVRRFWTLDPIDGTKGLLRGGQYAIALALIVDGAVQVGVLGCPRLSLEPRSPSGMARGEGGLAVAERGRGAWWTPVADGSGARLSVSTAADPARARVLHSREASHGDVARLGRLLIALGIDATPISMDSQVKHVVLASGAADLLLRFPTGENFREAIWDQAAGSVLIEEAGGRVSDLTGRPLDFSAGRRLLHNQGLVASNGHLHDVVLAALGRTA